MFPRFLWQGSETGLIKLIQLNNTNIFLMTYFNFIYKEIWYTVLSIGYRENTERNRTPVIPTQVWIQGELEPDWTAPHNASTVSTLLLISWEALHSSKQSMTSCFRLQNWWPTDSSSTVFQHGQNTSPSVRNFNVRKHFSLLILFQKSFTKLKVKL